MKRMIDDRGRLFGRVSVIDIIVLAVAIIIVVAAYTKFNVFDNPASIPAAITVNYTVKIPAIRFSNASLLRVGDTLYSLETGTVAGTITNVNMTEAVGLDRLVDGTIVEGRIEDRYDVLLTVEAQCSYSNGRYYAGRAFELSANSPEQFFTKYNEIATGLILTITAE